MAIKLRKAEPADVPAIARVHVDSWRSTYRDIVPEDHLAKMTYEERERLWRQVIADPAQHTLVADEYGRIVGFANGGKNRGEEPDYAGELYAVYLLQAFQQQGLGKRLTVEIARALEKSGRRSMIVWVLRDNPACEFYRRLGGEPVASKLILMGSASLQEVAFGWPDLSRLVRLLPEPA